MFQTILFNIKTALISSFDWAESLFSEFGLNLLILFCVMTAIAFVARVFIAPFLK